MSFYANVIFPRCYDWVMDKPVWGKHRRAQLADVRGEVLEIGVGTGLNLPYYPQDVRGITTVDPNPGMNKQLKRRLSQTGMCLDQRVLSCESLPFSDGTFDCVVSTMTLCSISNVETAMAEVYRVLKPGGRLLFLEHGLSPDAQVVRWQRRLNPLQRVLAGGCTLTLEVNELIATQPFSCVEFDNFYLDKTPRTHGYLYRGLAIK